MLHKTLGLALVAGLAVSANAGIFSFASDVDHSSFTFGGQGFSLGNAGDSTDLFDLYIDDDNGMLDPLIYSVQFQADFVIDHAGSIEIDGGLFVHTYDLFGEFGFYDADSGDAILTASINNGALTALGTETSWLSTSTILGADSDASDVTYVWNLADNPDYGLFNGASVGPADDAAFTLTFLQTENGAGVEIGSRNRLPLTSWSSEGSYSGSATFVPAPGSIALLAGAGLILRRRRR